MWQIKENQLPYELIQSNETILWNVVKRDMRPDSFEIIGMLREKNHSSKRRRINSKSQSSFSQLKKFISSPFNRNIQKIPEILVNKSLKTVEKPLCGSHQKSFNSKSHNPVLTRKKLFDTSLSSKLEVSDFNKEEGENDIKFLNIFTDTQLHLRCPERILFIESEYIKIYRDCWSRDRSVRYDAVKVKTIFKEMLSLL